MRTYYSIIVINNILREVERGNCHFPPALVEKLKRDKRDIELSEQKKK